jgi:hypothetical protein
MKDPRLAHLFSAQHIFELMRKRGRRTQISLDVLRAAFDLSEPNIQRADLIEETVMFFRTRAARVPRGIDALPSCWLRGLPGILLGTCKPEWEWIPYMLADVRLTRGVLRMSFAQEEPPENDRVTGWDNIRLAMNLNLRPNRWFPLARRLERQIWIRRPDLREELFRIPG